MIVSKRRSFTKKKRKIIKKKEYEVKECWVNNYDYDVFIFFNYVCCLLGPLVAQFELLQSSMSWAKTCQ